MHTDLRLKELFAIWQQKQSRGEPVSPEELCADCPNLIEALRAKIDAPPQEIGAVPTAEQTQAVTMIQSPEELKNAAVLSQSGYLEFPGYEILSELGRGGMGVVYKARDLKRDMIVALKTMQRTDANSQYRFKQEFRSLADITHPNLVALYDLQAEGRDWFFTMEFVEGLRFLQYVRGEPKNLKRLREAISQLAEGVAALHQAGKLHRDIKPSNILVSSTGRVVLLDFGLAAELNREGEHHSRESNTAGTWEYMAPEQAAGATVSAASDWYSVGVVLYQALTGQLPFTGTSFAIMRDKQTLDPRAPSEVVADIPDDLNRLCIDLLRRDPARRPNGPEILKHLQASKRQPAQPTAPVRVFVGREEQLAALADALAAVQRGHAVTMAIQGRSGVGKSTLVRHFLEESGISNEAVVLAGRCYERESVPYKALDSLVDALSRFLRQLPTAQVESLLPRDVMPLVRVFPVLRQVEAIVTMPPRAAEIPDLQELRRRAFAALRELLARLGDRRPLILFIDDLQWGDIDSAALLIDLVRPPDAPVLLLVACFRSEDAATSSCLRTVRESLDKIGPILDRRRLTLEPLTMDEVRRLTSQLLGTEDHTETVFRESGGNPFFVFELVQHLQMRSEGQPDSTSATITLDEALWARIQLLPIETRRLLEVIAVAGRPLMQRDAYRAARLPAQQRAAVISLRSGRLIRTAGVAELEEVEIYHDRVRETVAAHLNAEALQDHHHHLAEVFEEGRHINPEVLAIHWNGAKNSERAGKYYALAADEAAEALAFERAAKLYRQALELRPSTQDEVFRVRTKLADSLANAGRGTEAAREYLAISDESNPAEALEFQRRAAAQFLVCGRIDEGMGTLRNVLKAVNLPWAKTSRRALISLLWRRALIWLRGTGFRHCDESRIAPDDLTRMDVCWSAATGLSMVDPIRGADFQARHLLLALRSGEVYRVARSLALEAAHVASTGGRGYSRAEYLLAIANELATQLGSPHGSALVTLMSGIVSCLQSQWSNGLLFFEQAETVLKEKCKGVWWELDTARYFSIFSLYWMGEIGRMCKLLPVYQKEARDRGDLYALSHLGTFGTPTMILAADDPESALQQLAEVVGQWSHQGFHLQHFNAWDRRVSVHLYCGRATDAWRCLSEEGHTLTRSLLLRVQWLRTYAAHLRARCAVAVAEKHKQPQALLKTAETEVRPLRRERTKISNAWGDLAESGIVAMQGNGEMAAAFLRSAATAFDKLEMSLYAAAARRRLGQLVGGDEGRALVAQADAWMQGQGIVNPVRMTAMLAPGFPDAS